MFHFFRQASRDLCQILAMVGILAMLACAYRAYQMAYMNPLPLPRADAYAAVSGTYSLEMKLLKGRVHFPSEITQADVHVSLADATGIYIQNPGRLESKDRITVDARFSEEFKRRGLVLLSGRAALPGWVLEGAQKEADFPCHTLIYVCNSPAEAENARLAMERQSAAMLPWLVAAIFLAFPSIGTIIGRYK